MVNKDEYSAEDMIQRCICAYVQVRFELPLHAPRNWCDRAVYMFAFVQVLGCYAVAATCILVLTLAATCQRLSRLFYTWSSLSAAANSSTSNGKVPV